MRKFNVAPLNSSFLLFAMLGLIITGIYTYFGSIPNDWGVALLLVFAIMFIASMISMTYAPVGSQLGLKRHERHLNHHAPVYTHSVPVTKTETTSVQSDVALDYVSVRASQPKPKPSVKKSVKKATKKKTTKKKSVSKSTKKSVKKPAKAKTTKTSKKAAKNKSKKISVKKKAVKKKSVKKSTAKNAKKKSKKSKKK